jgi:ribosomal protein L37AE/L43A
MSVKCDGCGSEKDVRRAAMTIWNGNIIDLCKTCWSPISKMVDDIYLGRNKP